MKTIFKFFVCCALIGQLYSPMAQSADTDDMFIIRSTEKTPEAVVRAIKKYSKQMKWEFLGTSKVKQGQVTLVKICIHEVGRVLWTVGPHVSAMLPCGNLGVYQNKGKTEISLLNPRYMQVLYPHPTIEKASAMAQPLLMKMLETVAE